MTWADLANRVTPRGTLGPFPNLTSLLVRVGSKHQSHRDITHQKNAQVKRRIPVKKTLLLQFASSISHSAIHLYWSSVPVSAAYPEQTQSGSLHIPLYLRYMCSCIFLTRAPRMV
jgi:hypothetical protein